MRIKVLILVTALFTATAATAEPAIPKVQAKVFNSCTGNHEPAFQVYIAKPGQRKVDIQTPWLRILIGVEPKFYTPFTFRFDNRYVTVYLNGIASETVMGSVTFTRIADGKNLKGTFDLVTPAGENIVGRFNTHWQTEPGVLCGYGRSF